MPMSSVLIGPHFIKNTLPCMVKGAHETHVHMIGFNKVPQSYRKSTIHKTGKTRRDAQCEVTRILDRLTRLQRSWVRQHTRYSHREGTQQQPFPNKQDELLWRIPEKKYMYFKINQLKLKDSLRIKSHIPQTASLSNKNAHVPYVMNGQEKTCFF